MPISVVCPGCKARFTVSEKFAGKKGPCPKCKVVITIPDKPAEDVKIHEPEQFAAGGKDTKGRPVLKPIARKVTKLSPVNIAAIGGAVIATLVIAFLLRGLPNKVPVIVIGLLLVSPPLAVAGYTFLRDDELEPYRARDLVIRAVLCGLGYAALWAVYWLLAGYGLISGEPWQWLYVGPAFAVVGAGMALACFDLDFGSAALHYAFFVVVTMLLRWAIGLPPLWAAATGASPF
jgi:hypothetical protein